MNPSSSNSVTASAADAETPTPAARRWQWIGAAASILAAVVLGVRLLQLTNRYAVNILYYDQWDYLRPMFEQQSLWEMFLYRHGPHRQGLGAILDYAVLSATAWNSRAEAFVAAVGLIIACGLGLWLKVRAFGRLRVWDAAIPVVMLTPLQFEHFAAVPNASHSVVPAILLLGVCHTWISDRAWIRYGLSSVLVFLATFTGFGLFVGPSIAVLLGLDLIRSVRERRRGVLAWGLVMTVALMASAGLFLHGYKMEPAVDGWTFPAPNWREYPWFMATAIGNLAGRGFIDLRKHGFEVAAGYLMVAAAAISGLVCLTRIACGRKSKGEAVALLLIIFGLVFSANLAIGRLALGVGAARNSRYATLLGMLWLGTYFAFNGLRPISVRWIALGLLILGPLNGSLLVRQADRDSMRHYAYVKRTWRSVFLRTHDIGAAQAAAREPLHPAGEGIRPQLNFLESRKLNLFSDPPDTAKTSDNPR